MKYLQHLGLTALVVTALTAFMAGSASATTLEIGGVTQAGGVSLAASLKSGTSMTVRSTGGLFANTCTAASFSGTTTITSFTTVAAPLSSMSFTACSEEKVVVDEPGLLSIERIGFTTNGTVKSTGAKVTVPSPFGLLTCNTGSGTDLGTLTGSASGHATLDMNGVVNCGIVPSAVWEGTYIFTTPTGLGVVS